MPLPTISLQGNLTADPELRYTNTGKPLASFSVACNDRYKDQTTGEWKDGETTFVNVVSWRNGEAINSTLTKGSKVLIVGSLVQKNYETKEGQKRTAFEVKAEHVAQIIIDKSGASQTNSFPAESDPWPTAAPADPWATPEDETPF